MISIGDNDDEHMCHQFCKKYDKKIIANGKVPMVHLFFFTQREENKDLIPKIREYYTKWLDLPFPISICPNKEYENENRLRFIEQRLIQAQAQQKVSTFLESIFSIKNSRDGIHKVITIMNIRIKLKKKK